MEDEAIGEYVKTARDYPGNPSAGHALGKKAKEKLEDERCRISSILGVGSEEVVFTSGGSESISLVFQDLLWNVRPGSVVIGRLEHEAVSSFAPLLKEKGWRVNYIKPDRDGKYDTELLSSMIDRETKLIAIQSVNNVLGLVTNTKEIADVVRKAEEREKRNMFFFSDSVQAIGKVDFPLHEEGVDGASFSAHKIGGPRGTGFLYVRKGKSLRPAASQGGQERKIRGGTENLPGVSAMRKALEIAFENRKEKEEKVRKLNAKLREGLEKAGIRIFSPVSASPFVISIASPLPSEVAVRMLSDKGIYVSAGSACSENRKGEAMEILTSYGIRKDEAMRAIRISISEKHTEEDITKLVDEITKFGA